MNNTNKQTSKSLSLVLTALASGVMALSSAAFAAPSNSNVNYGSVTPADSARADAEVTLQQKVEDERGELLATQPGEVEIQTTTRIGESANDANTRVVNSVNSTSNSNVNYGNITPARDANNPAPITLQQKVEDERGELLATQPGEVELSRNQEVVLDSKGYSNITPVRGGDASATITLQQKIKDNRGELLATQPGEVGIKETRSIIIK